MSAYRKFKPINRTGQEERAKERLSKHNKKDTGKKRVGVGVRKKNPRGKSLSSLSHKR